MTQSSPETQRLEALRRLNLLDTPPEERFERLTNIAKRHYKVRTALFSLVDKDRQWFKSKQGLDLSETPRSIAFCNRAIEKNRVFIVPDALEDQRFKENPLVIGEPYIRFYAGMPVREPGGFKIGTLCLIDDKPRDLSELDMDVLRSLASIIEDELERAYLMDGRSEYVKVSHMGRSIQRAMNAFLKNTDEHANFELMLNDMLTLTGSQFGFIGEVLRKKNDAPFLKIGAITNISWNRETKLLYQEIERRGMIFDRLDNLIGQVMVTEQPIISDDISVDTRSGGLPPGHPPISSYIGIPVFCENELIGVVGLANRAGGYKPKVVSELNPLLTTVGNVIERSRVHQERQKQHQKLQEEAYFDSLTGLPNRRRFSKLLQDAIARAERYQDKLAICFLDLDGFKEINDRHGHAAGDAVLKTIAERLRNALRERDIVARLSGDEFVAVLINPDDDQVFNRMLQTIRQPINYHQLELQVSSSMGISMYPIHHSDGEQLLKLADHAMYAAKKSGKDCMQFSPS